ncbi:hypothetical protein EDD86DRAFT_110649 [Gorgonomyces haynaldii]|nr:hypothetical protein EDD86DRAFT_110649 [Gorgonomyces haynaldii]
MLFGVVLAACDNPAIRPAWRTLPEPKKQQYMRAIQKLKQRAPAPDLSNMAQINYDQFVQIHWDNVKVAHNISEFLPWHRYFILGYEKALQSIDPTILLPFWDWTLDSQHPTSSDVLQPQYFGGNGKGASHCVMDGVAAGWQTSYPTTRAQPSCLRRCFEMTTFWAPENVAALMAQSRNYDDFRERLEDGPHGNIHAGVGGQANCGDMGTMYSTNDPLFFLHHANVDRIWWQWQSSCPTNRLRYDGGIASPNTRLVPWNIPVSQVMETTSGPFCYNYQRSDGDLVLKTCPNAGVPTTSDWFWQNVKTLLPTSVQPAAPPSRNGTVVKKQKRSVSGLQYPPPIPEWYVIQNGYSLEKVRQFEAEQRNVTDHYNSLEGYVSEAALENWHKHNHLVNLTQTLFNNTSV